VKSARRRCRRSLALACVYIVVSTSLGSPAWAEVVERTYALFYEWSENYRGATAHWTDETWTGLTCDAVETNRVNTAVNAYGTSSGTWVQLGFQQLKPPPACGTVLHYYWEWQSTDHVPHKGFITDPSPRGTHYYTIERKTTGCSPGVSYCWHFIIDGSTKHTCCGDNSIFNPADYLSTFLECVDGDLDDNCTAVGLVDPVDFLRYKKTSDLWTDYAGTDYACIDKPEGARGKWLTDKSFRASMNVGIAGTYNGCVSNATPDPT